MRRHHTFRSPSWLAGLLLVCLLAALLPAATPARAAGPITLPLQAVADARVQGGGGLGGFGGGYIWVGSPDGHLAYVQFDMLDFPANAVISSAELRLSFQGTYDGAANVELGRNEAAWDEATVTWTTKPASTFSGITRPVGDDPATVSWPVTGTVQQWHAGSLPNYGFALRGDGVLKAFHSRETGDAATAPQLVVTYTVPPEEGPRPDLGDAPDSSNNPGVSPNTAYPGVPGNFPSVWASTPAGNPAGPRHANPSGEAILGDALSREVEADSGNDADGANNILDGGADNANNDRADDGWRNRNIAFPNCTATTLRVRVSKAQNAQLERMFLNVWFDGNRDGDWADRALCTPPNEALAIPAYEWLVQDYFVDLTGIPAGGFVDIDVPTTTILNSTPGERHWMRFTLSEERAPQSQNGRSDGRGPHPNSPQSSYRFGETEDVLHKPLLPGEDGVLELDKRVITGGEPVDWGDLVTYQIRLRHVGGTQPIEAAIRDVLPYPLHIHPTSNSSGLNYVTVSSPNGGAAPLAAQLDILPPDPPTPVRQAVKWQGTLTPDSAVILSFRVHVLTLCDANEQTETIVNRAEARARGGDPIVAEQSFVAKCLGYDENNIEVNPEPIESPIDPGDLNELPWRAEVWNRHDFPVTLGLYQPGAEIAQDGSGLLATMELAPNERKPVALDLKLGQGDDELKLPGDTAVEVKVSYCFMLPESDTCPDPEQYPGMHGDAPPVNVTPRPNDLGDAPDSTNHAGAAMSAYPGTPAGFPTVFDPATGLPQGPRHAHPRPFHLGPQVSREAEADVGPDADPSNNLLPAANNANFDRFDDGARLLSLAHCQPGTAEVRVFISPAAAAWFQQQGLQGYLNVWLDGNRDGDWADGVSCGGGPDGGGPGAVEHIVIDYPINVVALGAGLHTMTLPTGRVPFPAAQADKPTWVRFTLSEQVSDKPLQFGPLKYGDGRGYATPFQTGETEDYLRRADGDPEAAPDLGVRLDGRLVAGGGQNGADQVGFKLDYANLGSGPARGGSLTLAKPAQLRDHEIILLRAPGVPPANIVEAADTVTIALPDLAPGAGGTLMLRWEAPADQQPAGDYVAAVEARLNGDSVPANNSAEATLERRRPPPSVAVLAGDDSLWSSGETTCRDAVELRGVSIPGAVFDLWVDGTIEAALQDQDSSWNYSLGDLSDGRHAIYVAPNGATDPSIRSNLLRLHVDSGLPIDPLSLLFTDSAGDSYHPPTLRWQQLGDAITAYLRSGETYELGIDSCADDPNQQLNLTLPDGQVIELRDDDGDGRYTGSFTFGGAAPRALQQAGGELRLTVTGGGASQSFVVAAQPLMPGVVRDAASGQPLASATVSALGSLGTVFAPWPEAALGKPNGQLSDTSGKFSFNVPGGTGRLTATLDGYQPYTSWELAARGGVLAGELPLSPAIAEEASHKVYITAAGFEPALLEVPAGSVVEWINLDLADHSVSGAGWASGALAPGQSYKARLNVGGSFRFDDAANPAGGGTVLVEGGRLRIFLPLVRR